MKWKSFLVFIVFVLPGLSAGAVSLIILESQVASPTAVSADGSVVIGNGYGPFRWERGAILSLGESNWQSFNDLNADGSVLVGSEYSNPIRWEAGELIQLALPDGSYPRAAANAVSADGATIVGHMFPSVSGTGGQEAAIWENGVLSGLGKLDPNGESVALDVSADGKVIMGRANLPDASDHWVPFRWENGVMVSLGHPQEGNRATFPHAISADGRIIGGSSEFSDTDERAFIWEDGSFTILDHPDPFYKLSVVQDISSDGSVLVGYASADGDWSEGALWFLDNGHYTAMKLDSYLDAHGVDRGGFTTFEITAISADGSTLAGYGWNPAVGLNKSFIVSLGEPPRWGGFVILSNGQSIDTEGMLGILDISNAPWGYVYGLGDYIYLEEEAVAASGGWVWLPKQD